MVGVGETLGDDALKVSIDHRSVKCPPFTNDAVGERNPALGAFADTRKPRLALLERQRPQINAVGNQQVEGHVSRPAARKEQLVEERAPSRSDSGSPRRRRQAMQEC